MRGGTARRRSITLQSPVQTSFTGAYMSCGMARSSTRLTISRMPLQESQARSTVNHFGGSVSGPIAHDKLFFFFDSEWVRIALPIVTATTVPTQAFQNYVLQQLPLGEQIPSRGSLSAIPTVGAVLSEMFSLYGNTNGTPLTYLAVRSMRAGCADNCQ